MPQNDTQISQLVATAKYAVARAISLAAIASNMSIRCWRFRRYAARVSPANSTVYLLRKQDLQPQGLL